VNLNKIKFKFLLSFFKNKKKLLWTLKNQLFESETGSPKFSILELSKNTVLGKKNEKMYVVNDSYQSWNLINDASYQNEFIERIKELIDKNMQYDFIDIGANIGLMTKCLLNNKIKIKNSYCIEPNAENFFCLKNNLKNFKNINLFNFALDVKDGKKKLYLDKNNKGNLSFYSEMMSLSKDKLNFLNSKKNYEIIKCKNIKNFFNKLSVKENIIKIDTQGYDEIIFQEIPEKILKKNKIMIIEISPINSKKINFKKYYNNLKFYKKFTDFNGKKYSKQEVLDLSKNTEGKNIDLIFLN